MSHQKELPFYREDGSGAVTVFLFHGAYGDGRYFKTLSEHLVAAGYRTIVWDCPGYGGTEPLYESTIESFSEAATALVDELGTEHNILFGHSMGSLIVPRVAVQTKKNILGAVLSAGSPGFKARSPEDQKRFLKERLDPIREGSTVAEYAPTLLKTMMGEGAQGPEVDLVVQVISEMETDVFERSLIALTKYDGRPTLEQVKVPVLLIAGEQDTACPPAGMQVIADHLDNPTLKVIEGIGHYGFAENFDAYTSVIDKFLQELHRVEVR